MDAIKIIGFFMLIIIIEAITDGTYYLSWVQSSKKIFGVLHHITQLLWIPIIFLFGHYYTYSIWDVRTIYLIVTFAMFHFGFLDLFYNWITKNTTIGTTSFWDRFMNWLINSKHTSLVALGAILDNTVIRLIIAFCAGIILARHF